MINGNYILVNGSFIPEEEYRISLPEADGFLFSEKIRSVRSAFPFFNETLDVIKFKLLLFNQPIPDFMENNGAVLKRQMERTLTKNKHFLGAELILTFRVANQKVYFTIQSEKLDNIGFDLNEKGLYVTIFNQIQKAVSSVSNLSLGSEIYWNIAGNHLKELMVDHLLIINTDKQILEIPESNLYVIIGKTVKGANRKQGAYVDITKPLMIELFRRLNLEFTEKEGIANKDLQEADEVFVVNAIDGIRWIIGFEGKRYFNQTIRKISELFNQINTN